jgi:hypothetical protein
VVLKAKANGFSPLTYFWIFNNTNLIVASTTCSNLCLTNLQYSQSGAYSLIVTNSYGSLTSSPVMLSIIPPVPKKVVPALKMTGDVGSFLHLICANTLGPGVTWQELDTLTLSATQPFYCDLTLPSPTSRFYRVWQTNAPSVRPMPQMILAYGTHAHWSHRK